MSDPVAALLQPIISLHLTDLGLHAHGENCGRPDTETQDWSSELAYRIAKALSDPATRQALGAALLDDTLDAAWREAEEALPEGWFNGPTLFGYDTQDGGRFYVANVEAPKPYPRAKRIVVTGEGDTAIAALRALRLNLLGANDEHVPLAERLALSVREAG